MATDYGLSLRVLDDLPVRADYVSGAETLAYALARRLITPSGGYNDCGDPSAYDSIDLRKYVGSRMSASDLAARQAEANAALQQDERVLTVSCVLTVGAGELLATVDGDGDEGPFRFVASIDEITATILEAT